MGAIWIVVGAALVGLLTVVLLVLWLAVRLARRLEENERAS
jgi:hypothetical protein